MDDFAKTRLGHEYLRSTLPGLVKQISRLADGVATLNETLGSWIESKAVGRVDLGAALPMKRCAQCGAVLQEPEHRDDERRPGSGEAP